MRDEQAGGAFTPAPTATAVNHVVAELRKAIVSGRLAPGARLVELDLAEGFQVSRGPIREALRKLSYEGLVTLRPNRGAVVSSLSGEDVLEVYVLRAVLGSVAIRHLIGAGPVTPAVVGRLRKLAGDARRESSTTRQTELVDTDLAFQDAVVAACGLPRVVARFRESTAEVRMFVAASGITYTDVERILAEHDEFVGVIESRDAERADRLWHEHLRRAVREFLDLVPDGDALAARREALWRLL